MTNNDYFATQLLNEAKSVQSKADTTQSNLKNLQMKYDSAKQKLNSTIVNVENSKERAKTLMNKSLNLSGEINKIDNDIQKFGASTHSDELMILERDIKDLTDRMDKYNAIIRERSDYYKNCN